MTRASVAVVVVALLGHAHAGVAQESVAQVRHLILRPLDGPFPDSARSCEDARDRWCEASFAVRREADAPPTPPGVSFGIVLRQRTQRYWLRIETARGSFYSHASVGAAPPGYRLGYRKEHNVGRMVVVTWSWGKGDIDPPDSTYAACAHLFVVCAFDDEIPRCSAAVMASAKRCPSDQLHALSEEVPPPRVLSDGETFEVEGRLYRASRPHAEKR